MNLDIAFSELFKNDCSELRVPPTLTLSKPFILLTECIYGFHEVIDVCNGEVLCFLCGKN
jgi:hypothetical protein